MTDILESLKEEVGKCISCGFCESVCPTLPAAGYDLWKGARGRVIMGNELLKSINEGKDRDLEVSDSFYSCLDCFACLQVCPAGVNAGVVSHLSRSVIVARGNKRNENPYARMIVKTTMKYMNPLGVRAKSAEWSAGIEFDPASEDLLYTGNMYQLMAYTTNMNLLRERMGEKLSRFMAGAVSEISSLIRVSGSRSDPIFAEKLNQSLRNISRLLQMSGVKFNYLGEEEPYPGTFIYDLGYLSEFRSYANRVYTILKKSGARRIITVDPHTYDLMRNIYPEYIENFDLEVVFYADLIKDIGFKKMEGKVVYHEPCHFVLRKDSYSRPLDLIARVSDVKLAPRSGKRNKCCGGPDELIFPDLSERISQERYRELLDTGADQIITACPICLTNLSKGDRTIDMADLLVKSLGR